MFERFDFILSLNFIEKCLLSLKRFFYGFVFSYCRYKVIFTNFARIFLLKKIPLRKLRSKIVLASILLAFASTGCSTLSQVEKAERNAAKQERKEMRQAQKAYNKALKRHRKNQDKRTRAQIKEGKKQSDKWNQSRNRKSRTQDCNND